jgi:site-specific DNA-methyltransferase (adenine-specific)
LRLSGFKYPPVLTNRLIVADAIEAMQSLSDCSIDLILTDPPYGIEYQSNRRMVGKKFEKIASDTSKEMERILQGFFHESFRVLKPACHLYTFCRWDTLPLFMDAATEYGFKIKNRITWIKNNHGSGDLYGAYAPRHEDCLFMIKPGHSVRVLRGRRTSDVVFCNKVSSVNLKHAAQKPLRLLTPMIEKSSEPYELVLDPFCGSGAILKAAKLMGRKYLGFDSDRSMIAIAKQNLEEME